jgi:lipopolysaccharide transport system ATP-binding protein
MRPPSPSKASKGRCASGWLRGRDLVAGPAITVEGLGKQYRLGSGIAPYGRLTETLSQAIARVRQRGSRPRASDTFWALRDVDFEVAEREVLGVVGRNGAGKSTLLKILSRITPPTEGRAVLRGRVGSLLEVGTGFHPELSGRENVFLNGAILGMKAAEIRRKFDEIVAFSEIERFLDTPVKRYSSGMYVRLAFAVAAHLDPEILVVDEVLAVGDAAFQKKCLGKMDDLAHEGRTVLFVSHNMTAVQRLCTHAILLEQGRVVASGAPGWVVERYLAGEAERDAEIAWADPASAPGDEVARLHSIAALGPDGAVARSFDIREPIDIQVAYWNLSASHRPSVGIHVLNAEGTHLFASQDFTSRDWMDGAVAPGLVTACCRIPGNFLAEGRFLLNVTVSSFSPTLVHHAVQYDAIAFEVYDHSDGDSVRGPTSGEWPGVVRPMLDWRVNTSVVSSRAPFVRQ